MSDPTPVRRRDSQATREAILAAAVVEFTENGYARAGVRQIADRAGVTAMMINRYFGSKEGLFAEAVDRAFETPTIVGDDGNGLAATIAQELIRRTAEDADRLDPFLLMLRSAADPDAGPIIRQGIETHVGARFADLLEGPESEARAQLGLALVAGTWLMRAIVKTNALATADPARLTEMTTRMFDAVTAHPAIADPDRD